MLHALIFLRIGEDGGAIGVVSAEREGLLTRETKASYDDAAERDEPSLSLFHSEAGAAHRTDRARIDVVVYRPDGDKEMCW